jgi:hypothetical protein
LFGVRGQEQQDTVVRTMRGLAERGTIRIIDVVYATKREDGTLVPGRATTLTEEERKQYGAIAGALIGFGYGGTEGVRAGAEWGMQRAAKPFTEREFGESVIGQMVFGESAQEIREHLKDAAEDLPVGAGVAVALIEHRWIPQLKEDLQKQGVLVLGTGLIRPRTLVMLGATMAQAQEMQAQA